MFRLIKHPTAVRPDRYDVGLIMTKEEADVLTYAIRSIENIPDASLKELYEAQPHKLFYILNQAANNSQPYPPPAPNHPHWLSCIGVVEEPCNAASVDFHIGIVPDGFDTDNHSNEDVSWSEVVATMAEIVVASTLQQPESQE